MKSIVLGELDNKSPLFLLTGTIAFAANKAFAYVIQAPNKEVAQDLALSQFRLYLKATTGENENQQPLNIASCTELGNNTNTHIITTAVAKSTDLFQTVLRTHVLMKEEMDKLDNIHLLSKLETSINAACELYNENIRVCIINAMNFARKKG